MRRFFACFLFIALPFATYPDPFEQLWQETTTAYETFGNEKYMIQEEITQINHILQAAAIAKLAGAPPAIVIALLFHDIGQVIKEENIGNLNLLHYSHAEVGGEWLEKKGFPSPVYDFVKNHALAKVMLCQTDPFYYDNLSLASQISYAIQKERYDQEPEKVFSFMKHPLAPHFLAGRKCDDLSKMKRLTIEKGTLPKMEDYYDLASAVYRGELGSLSTDWIEVVDKWHREMAESPDVFEVKMIALINQAND